MVTLKQLEALYWIGRLGSFEAAARHLQTSQSTITRRIQDFEQVTGAALFDRTTRVPTLSRRGQEACLQAAGILESTDQLVAGLSSPEMIARRVSIGVTELSSFSWIPDFMRRVHATFPRLELDLRVGSAFKLRQMLVENELDLVVVPSALYPPGFTLETVGSLTTSFCGARGEFPQDTPLNSDLLTGTPLIAQENTLFDQVVARSPRAEGTDLGGVIVADGLLAMIALVTSNYGISVLPDFILDTAPFSAAVSRISPDLKPDPLAYVVAYSESTRSPAVLALIELIQETCRFDQFFAGIAPGEPQGLGSSPIEQGDSELGDAPKQL
ncbi:MAG: LysR family transcriptional regulator [Sulfitobacter dubius]